MLTAIPEVDLGIDTKIKNIEATQRAKRQILNTALTHARPDPSKQTFSQNRWIIPHSSLPSSDLNSLAKSLQSDSRGDNVGVVTNDGKLLSEIKKDRISEEEREKKRLYWEQQKEKRMMATDEIVFERFKKKMRR
ncbi:hypothetical protein BKA69DRAFT_1072851 [Paraphysoderma sedebokerense]|nr:hypothetical protein BKA69DRAFT_1072851 [Paraphysoderma sedebokerense]